MKNKIAIVAPCHIPPSVAWIANLQEEAREGKADVIIVDDSDGNLGDLPNEWTILGYGQQADFLGELYPRFAEMFHKSSACRVLGHLFAYANGYEYIIGLDSDCIVPSNFVRDHMQFMGKPWGSGWFNPIGSPVLYPRGFPYSYRNWPVVANMGLWRNVLDLNGKDRQPREPKDVRIPGSISPTCPFPYSGMNFALTAEASLGFLFLPNIDYGDSRFRRIDDIWGGYIFQRFMALKRQSAMVGHPVVFHDTIVVPEEDVADEQAMYDFEDEFIDLVDRCIDRSRAVNKPAPESSYRALWTLLAYRWEVEAGGPFVKFTPAFLWWVEAINKYEKSMKKV